MNKHNNNALSICKYVLDSMVYRQKLLGEEENLNAKVDSSFGSKEIVLLFAKSHVLLKLIKFLPLPLARLLFKVNKNFHKVLFPALFGP